MTQETYLLAGRYHDNLLALQGRIRDEEISPIAETGRKCAETIAANRIVWVFGAGHSSMMAMEAYPRIGGVQGFVPMIEPGLLQFMNVVGSGGLEQTLVLERVTGYAQGIHNSYGTAAGDLLIIYSSSGVEVLIIEMAEIARARGLTVVAVTSDAYSRQAAKERGKDKRLAEIADVVIDNKVPAGDASVALDGMAQKVGPVSSILNLTIQNMISAETAAGLQALSRTPTLFRSPHLGGEAEKEFDGRLNGYRRMFARRWLSQYPEEA